uniref:NFAM1 Ig-like domain-containing protein n=1 Tax=Amazona collaria TaxID=241587 RepID=A0A8B9F250_9PSIT
MATWRCPSRGASVNVWQKPPIQVVLLEEGISIPCTVIFPYMPKYTTFSIFYYWINPLGQKTSIYSKLESVTIPPGEENKTATVSYKHIIKPLENTSSTGTYYCDVKWNNIHKMGKGVFVLARGAGYVETSYGWEVLITFTVLLAALSIAATALLLWKRKVLFPKRNQLNILTQKVETQPPSAVPPPPSPVYDCLDLQQVDVYSILKDNTNNPSPRKSPPGKVRAEVLLLESFLMPWAHGERSPTESPWH